MQLSSRFQELNTKIVYPNVCNIKNVCIRNKIIIVFVMHKINNI